MDTETKTLAIAVTSILMSVVAFAIGTLVGFNFI